MVKQVVYHVNRRPPEGLVSSADAVTAAALLRTATQLVDGIQAGLAARGFDDVRPSHGFAFSRISGSRATTSDVAAHLGITKQAAGQLVEHLVGRGYLERRRDPADARARLLVLTDRGVACTAAAEEAMGDVVRGWRETLPRDVFEHLRDALGRTAAPGPLRPAW